MNSVVNKPGGLVLPSPSGDVLVKEFKFAIDGLEVAGNLQQEGGRAQFLFPDNGGHALSAVLDGRGGDGVSFSMELLNKSAREFAVSSASISFSLALGEAEDCVFYHPQNIKYVRIQEPDHESYTKERLFRTPDKELHLGDSEDYPLPVLAVLNKKMGAGFIVGASTENIFNKEFILTPCAGGLRVEVLQKLRGSMEKRVAPGGSIAFESLYLAAGGADFDWLLRAYRDEIRGNNTVVFDKSPLRRELVWGSWNMKIHNQQSEDLILRNAEYIKAHFPKVGWVQIDEGWSVDRMWGECAYPNLEGNVDRAKFPHGMKYVADRIKDLGLKPALWFPRMCMRDSRLYREKPHWFAVDHAGVSFLPNGRNATLDPSVPEVQEYLHGAFDTILGEWGYMGLKLDFFSEAFFARDICYRCQGKSGLELMWEMFRDVRERLPLGGYFLPGSMVGNANVFLGKCADIMRYAFDIDELERKPKLFFELYQKSALLSMLGSDKLVLCDSDAVGYFPYLDEKVEKCFAMWCYMSGMMMEIGGDLPNADQRRLLDLKPLFDHPVNGSECKLLTPDFFSGNSSPLILLNQKHRLLGIFNHHPDQRAGGVFQLDRIPEGPQPTQLLEFWSGAPARTQGGALEYELGPLEATGVRW